MDDSGGGEDFHPRVEAAACKIDPRMDDNGIAPPYPSRMLEASIGEQDAREADQPIARWLRSLGVTTLAIIIVLSLLDHPSASSHGAGLAVALALVAMVAGFALLLRHTWSAAIETLALIAVIAASATLIWTQSGGAGLAGMFLASGYAGTRLPTRHSLAILVLAAAAFAFAAAHQHRSAAAIVATQLGIVAFYVLAAFARRIREAHEQTQGLLAELEASRRSQEEAAALRERSRIAREIHDVLAHSLSGLMLQLEAARMLALEPSANGQLASMLDRAHDLARHGVEEARRAIGALRDDELPGVERLERLARDFSDDSGIEVSLEVTGVPRRLDAQASLAVFRVAQEALTNARKHAQPTRVELRLAYEEAGTRLLVEDHGAPSRPRAAVPAGAGAPWSEPGGYGLTGMGERAELLGGSLEASPTEDGFRVELWVPDAAGA